MPDFEAGELILYQSMGRIEIGKIKSLHDGGAFVWYHSGDTAAHTSYENMYKIQNRTYITETILGGESDIHKIAREFFHKED